MPILIHTNSRSYMLLELSEYHATEVELRFVQLILRCIHQTNGFFTIRYTTFAHLNYWYADNMSGWWLWMKCNESGAMNEYIQLYIAQHSIHNLHTPSISCRSHVARTICELISMPNISFGTGKPSNGIDLESHCSNNSDDTFLQNALKWKEMKWNSKIKTGNFPFACSFTILYSTVYCMHCASEIELNKN